jgi:hypothetical protein
LALAALVLCGINARASFPGPKPEPAEALRRANAVFEGELVSCDVPDLSRWWYRLKWTFLLHRESPPPHEVAQTMVHLMFIVKQVWKGDVFQQVVIASPEGSGGDCGTIFKVGARYLVYAREYGGVLVADGLSDRTTSTESASGELDFLAAHSHTAP